MAERDAETTPLLRTAPDGADQKPVEKSSTRLILAELRLLSQRSVPVVLSYILQNSIQTCSILIVGRLGPDELSIAAFSYMFATSTAWLLGMGGTTAIDTFGGAAWTASSDKKELGLILQRTVVVLTLLYIPFVLLWMFSHPLFILLGQTEYIARNTNLFLALLAPGGLGYICFESLKKFLQVQERMGPATHVLLVTSPMNIGLHYLLVYVLDFGIWGAPIATSATYIVSAVLLAIYAGAIARETQTWGGFDRQGLRNLGMLTRTAVFGVAQVGSEWLAFEMVAIVAGQLGRVPLAAQSVIMTFDQVGAMLPFGIGVAVSARISNLLGARDAQGARRSAHVGAALAVAVAVVVMTVLLITRRDFSRLFTDDPEVISLTASVLPYVALFQIADGLNGSCGGALRGMSLQHIGAGVNLCAYYVAALPLGIYLALSRGWGLHGLWMGQCLALWTTGVVEYVIVASRNWTKEVTLAIERLQTEREPLLMSAEYATDIDREC